MFSIECLVKEKKVANWLGLFVVTFILIGILSGCKSEGERPERLSTSETPLEYATGEEFFNKYCAQCHGEKGLGTDKGPPFVHKIYNPNHHADLSFQFAAQRGVRSHHWRFGDMPKVEGVTEKEVNEIIGYVRWLQRQAGIY